MLKLSCGYSLEPARATAGTSFVQTVFGIGPEAGENLIARELPVPYAPGQIVLFIGPSGSGKSSLLRAAATQCPKGATLGDDVPQSGALIDLAGPDPKSAAHVLSLCGLSEAFVMLRSPRELSDGQRYRFALARAIASGADTLVADEWCATLDRVTAKVVSRNARKICDVRNVGLLAATTHEDLLADLQPDTVVWSHGSGHVEVEQRRPFAGRSAFWATSRSPTVPCRTGRTSHGGITGERGSGPCGESSCSGMGPNRSESV